VDKENGQFVEDADNTRFLSLVGFFEIVSIFISRFTAKIGV